MKADRLEHEFVELMPDVLKPGTLYISIEYTIAIHLCACGCGEKVVTPFSPAEWRMTFDGDTVSLHPSIGNWSFDCQSHYLIERNRVRWAKPFSKEMINRVRAGDAAALQRYHDEPKLGPPVAPEADAEGISSRRSIWDRLIAWWPYRRQ